MKRNKIAIYARKSKYTDSGESINTQIEKIKSYLGEDHADFSIFIDEGFSGGNLDRPEFQRLYAAIKRKEFDTVAVYKIDRIARNVVDFFKLFGEFEKYGVDLVSATEDINARTAQGRFMITMLAGVADMERSNIITRVTDGMEHIAACGFWTGGALPLGYKSIRVIEAGKEHTYLLKDKSQAEIVEYIYKTYTECCKFKETVRRVNCIYDLSLSTCCVKTVLTSPRYVGSNELISSYLSAQGFKVYGENTGKGYLTYNLQSKRDKMVIVSKHEPIIDPYTWLKAQEIRKNNAIAPRPSISSYTWLAHKVYCGYCNKPMRVKYIQYSTKTGKKSKCLFIDMCSCRNLKGNQGTLSATIAERAVLKFIKTLYDPAVIKSLITENKNDDTIGEIKSIKKEIKTVDSKIANLTDKLSLASDNVVNILMSSLENLALDKKKLQEKLLTLENKNNNSSIDEKIQEICRKAKYISEDFNNLDIEEKRYRINAIIDRVEYRYKEKNINIVLRK